MTSNSKRTGLSDSLGQEIRLGDTVLDQQGLTGKVVFTNGAYRYDTANGHFLTYHSSLLFGDGCGTSRLTVIERFFSDQTLGSDFANHYQK